MDMNENKNKCITESRARNTWKKKLEPVKCIREVHRVHSVSHSHVRAPVNFLFCWASLLLFFCSYFLAFLRLKIIEPNYSNAFPKNGGVAVCVCEPARDKWQRGFYARDTAVNRRGSGGQIAQHNIFYGINNNNVLVCRTRSGSCSRATTINNYISARFRFINKSFFVLPSPSDLCGIFMKLICRCILGFLFSIWLFTGRLMGICTFRWMHLARVWKYKSWKILSVFFVNIKNALLIGMACGLCHD